MSSLPTFDKVSLTNGHAKLLQQPKSPTYCPRPSATVVKNSANNHHSTLLDDDSTIERSGMKRFFKRLAQAIPASVTWFLILGCSGAFFYGVVPAIIKQFNVIGIILCAFDAVLFLFLISNLFMATNMVRILKFNMSNFDFLGSRNSSRRFAF